MMRLSVDVGGTFTDLVLVDDTTGKLHVHKLPSTPGSGAAVVAGTLAITAAAQTKVAALSMVSHGFTIATNAWLTRSGARVVLLTTDGFGDILALGSQRRAHTYDLRTQKPPALVPRERVLEVRERIDAFGGIVTALEDQVVSELIRALTLLQPEAVAISLLFACVNASHERQLETAIQAALPGVPVYCSYRVNPELEEYPRANTTVAAAYVGPVVHDYTTSLEREFETIALRAPLRYTRSDGGAATPSSARANPASMLLSGPAGIVLASQALGHLADAAQVIAFDMGGTSADFAVVVDRHAGIIRETWFDGLPLRVPMLEVKTISAGGGSIAHVDQGGGLHVGPQSAGAQPGPACYAQGGTQATLTDAALALGIFASDAFLDGQLPLDIDAARSAIDANIAVPLKVDTNTAALGMVDVAVAGMGQAIRELATERGLDLAEFALLACGGAGGVFAPFLLRDLGLKEVIVPRYPGVFAAQGLQYADIRHTAQTAYPSVLNTLTAAELADALSPMCQQLDQALAADGIDVADRRTMCSVDARYLGQYHQIEAPIPVPAELNEHSLEQLSEAFHALHERRYGHAHLQSLVEIVNLHVTAIGATTTPPSPRNDTASTSEPSAKARRTVYCEPAGAAPLAQVFDRTALSCGHILHGPAIIEQADATVLILDGQIARVDAYGFIHISECNNHDC
jgi:N-methylhydantoinase A